MFGKPARREETLLRSKLSPPQLHRRVLARPTLTAKLVEALDYRLTHVHAGTGYSKTTALATLAGCSMPLYWYTVGEADADPQRFLSYLLAAFRVKLPNLSVLSQTVLQESTHEGNSDASFLALDALLNALHGAVEEPSILVVDDFHLVSHSPEIGALMERFVEYLPPDLHLVISSRYPLVWSNLLSWRTKGEVQEIDRSLLAFRPDEVEALFSDIYGIRLSPDELAALMDRTEGWPIALQLVWQGLRDSPSRSASDLLNAGSSSLGTLFEYLAHDVLDSQQASISAFLRETALLRELVPGACDAVLGITNSEQMIVRLLELDLFVVRLGEGHYRYHHLFHDFLRQRASSNPEEMRSGHTRAAVYFESVGTYEEAIYHWLQAGDLDKAAGCIEQAGEEGLRAGWLDTVATWIDALPPEVLDSHPLLQAYLGDIYRMRSRFDEALAWYQQAERVWRSRSDPAGIGRALRGQALVYLDTVRPAQAESYLEEALSLTEGLPDRQSRARLLELLAENKLNMGKPEAAETLRSEARALREEGPGDDALSVRVKLRTGKLDEAQTILESWAAAERRKADLGEVHPPRAHRETLLILSLIYAMRGDGQRAFKYAEEAIALGSRLESPFITAVGHTRLGHAWQLRAQAPGLPTGPQAREQTLRCYNNGSALGDKLAVRRMRAEVMWGATRAYGFGGDLISAERAALEGIETGRWAGDAWIVALIELALGASYVLAGRYDEAVGTLTRVLAEFRDCGDTLGRAASRLWLALAYHESGQAELSAACMDDCLLICEANGYSFLFTRVSLLGPPDTSRVVPLLLQARVRRARPAYVSQLLAELGLSELAVHPGYRLRVLTLGTFRVFRGDTEVEPRDWQRGKARQLFQLLLTRRGQWLQRDEISDILWPNLSADAAARDFKVALNALNKALEPGRLPVPDAPFAFIVRDGSAYRIRPEADIWLDAAHFENAVQLGLRLADACTLAEAAEHLQTAADLYGGNFLPEAVYEDWASAERERLLSLYLRSADKLSRLLIEQHRYEDAVRICDRIIAQDACWERAYRSIMLAHARQGERTLALRAYGRCKEALSRELGMQPSEATTALYNSILQQNDLSVTVL